MSAPTTNIILDDNPSATAGLGNPHGAPRDDGKRVLTRKVRFGNASTDTITVPFICRWVEGLGPAETMTPTITATGGGSTSCAFAGVSTTVDKILKFICDN